MALDSTVGSSTMNSYVDLSSADSYFDDRFDSTDWDDLDDDEKEALLITSSKTLDWYIEWKGTKTSSTQYMQWPRSDVYRSDDTEIDDDVIPDDLKTAVYEFALSSVSSDRTKDSDLSGISSLKLSSLSIVASEGYDSNEADTIPTKIYKILSDLRKNSSVNVIRLIRA